MQSDPADELHVVVHHVPLDLGPGSHPLVRPNRLVAIDDDAVAPSGHLVVPFRGGHAKFFVLRPAPRRFLHERERFGQDFFQHHLERFVDARIQRIDLIVTRLLRIEVVIGHGIRLSPQNRLLFHERLQVFLNALPQPVGSFSQAIVRKGAHRRFVLVHIVDDGLNGLDIVRGFVADEFLEELLQHATKVRTDSYCWERNVAGPRNAPFSGQK